MMFCIFEQISICLSTIQWKDLKIALILSITEIKPVYKFPSFQISELQLIWSSKY